MARINLLPWREERRQQQQKEFVAMIVGALLITVGLVGLTLMYFQGEIDNQISRNNRLKNEIAQLEKDIKEIEQLEKLKTSLIARMDVIQTLQASRPQIVHLVDEIIDAVPDGTYLTSLKQEKNLVTVEGKAQSNARVSALMRGIDKAGWMNNPDLKQIIDKDRTKSGLYQFKLGFAQTSPASTETPE